MTAKKVTHKSTCSYCGVGCGIEIETGYNGKIRVKGDELHPVNKGKLCSKGMNLHHVVEDKSDRFLYPEMRLAKGLSRTRVSWDQALDKTTATFKSIIDRYGSDSVGFYVSGQCLTEEYYIVNKLSKGFIGTNNIDTNSRLCMSSAVVGYKKALGEDSVPITYEDIELADCFFITGANPAWCHPIIFRRIEAHKSENPDVKIVVADPRRTQTCELADLHLQLNPGTDITLNNAIARVLIDRGYKDEAFVKNHTEGAEELLDQLKAIDLKEASAVCGVPLSDIELAAEYIGQAKGFISMWAMGLNQSVEGVNKNLSLLNLSLLTGKIGKPGNGPFSLTGQPNAMGGREVGGMCNLLPAHRNLADPEHRQQVADFWKVDSVPAQAGYSATEMFDALAEDKLKAVWIICTNPLVSLPNARKYEEALKKARFVVVQDISKKSITASYADVVLPAAGWLEKEGTMTNSDRRISYLPKLLDAPGEALSDVEILNRFAQKMGYHGFDYKNTEAIFKEHAALTCGTRMNIDGLDYTILKEKRTIQWPYDKASGEDTKRLFIDHSFYTPTHKAQLHAVLSATPIGPDPAFPLLLTTGRVRDQWHTMTRTGKVNRLNRHVATAYLEIHPSDAEVRGIADGDMVEVLSSNGNVRVKAVLTPDIKQGIVFLPMHWGKVLKNDLVRANNLTSDRIDPFSKEPDFKFSVVEVKKYQKPKQNIVIVGAGAAAYQFVLSYREKNTTDSIKVFSKESVPFYNRVQLPDYVSGEKDWNDLLKLDMDDLPGFKASVYLQNHIIHIDRENKTVVDSKGDEHAYDVLILGTGSRANYPRGISAGGKGIITIRTREDADLLSERTQSGHQVCIVGGGILGLEMASSLQDRGATVSMVHRNFRLMDRQMDDASGVMLGKNIADAGIYVHYNDEVDDVFHVDDESTYQVLLKSGNTFNCNTVIFAIGTTPNIELAREAQLKTRWGVVVNEYLQTSDPNIYALGEIAEFKGNLCGITVAAEEQATVAAHYIAGDITSVYQGTVPTNILKFPGIDLVSMGEIEKTDEETEEILFIDRSAGYYKKCLIRNDRLVGCILLGNKDEYQEFKKLISSGMELSELRLKLLRSNTPVKPMKGKLVCSCNNVGDINIEEELKNGTLELAAVCENTGAGTGCGSCKPEVMKIIERSVKAVV